MQGRLLHRLQHGRLQATGLQPRLLGYTCSVADSDITYHEHVPVAQEQPTNASSSKVAY